MYIPIVVAMSSIQNVVAALSGGMVAILGGALAVVLGFLLDSGTFPRIILPNRKWPVRWL